MAGVCEIYYYSETTFHLIGMSWADSSGNYVNPSLQTELSNFARLVDEKKQDLICSGYFDDLRDKNAEIEYAYIRSEQAARDYSNGREVEYNDELYTIDRLRWVTQNGTPVSLDFNALLYEMYIKQHKAKTKTKAGSMAYEELKKEADFCKKIFDEYHNLMHGRRYAEKHQYYLVIPATEATIYYERAIDIARCFQGNGRSDELKMLLPKLSSCYRNTGDSLDAISLFERYYESEPEVITSNFLNTASASYSDEKKYEEAFICFKLALKLRGESFDPLLNRTGKRLVRESFDRGDGTMLNKLRFIMNQLSEVSYKWNFENAFRSIDVILFS